MYIYIHTLRLLLNIFFLNNDTKFGGELLIDFY